MVIHVTVYFFRFFACWPNSQFTSSVTSSTLCTTIQVGNTSAATRRSSSPPHLCLLSPLWCCSMCLTLRVTMHSLSARLADCTSGTGLCLVPFIRSFAKLNSARSFSVTPQLMMSARFSKSETVSHSTSITNFVATAQSVFKSRIRNEPLSAARSMYSFASCLLSSRFDPTCPSPDNNSCSSFQLPMTGSLTNMLAASTCSKFTCCVGDAGRQQMQQRHWNNFQILERSKRGAT